MTVLLREAIGERLRRTRTAQRRTLREVSRLARVSLGYLSEVERGRKEASSELLASICEALDLPLSALLGEVAADVRLGEFTVPDTVPDTVEAATRTPSRAGAGESGFGGGRLVAPALGEDLAELRLQPLLRHQLNSPIGGPHVAAGVVVAA
ncbi:helix-turn-helix domain-containing protein [Crossiella cryophila]|uniref:Transcriptional regulator with XRE-family HTH domain n=1 Tax=Crossiella cryophila TaxID=43355 RepID=A0A7W7CLZ9_9PSEU|nr:helix-turn-helix transcriptional regulator [Crossiella cryophila]MBB4681874.1 transcriptional regulator with XRE-family HTH domain [Crossiella cryophila]